MHVKGLEQQVRLMAHALSQALVLRTVKVVLQDGLVVRMCALVDNDSSPLAGRKATDIRETLDILSVKYSVTEIKNRAAIPAQ